MTYLKSSIAIAAVAVLAACSSPARYGMVKDPATGLQFGSVVEKNIVTDASFYENRHIKVRIRNTSGDTTFDLLDFQRQIERSYQQSGYQPTQGDDFGLLVDINVMYSGHVQKNMAREFGFLGAVTGGLAGANTGRAIPTIGGAVAGATLASIVGSFVTDDTYIIVSRVTFGVVKGAPKRDGKRVTFSDSNFAKDDAEEKERHKKGFSRTYNTGVAVFAGGRNVEQSAISGGVRERIARIIKDII